MAAALLPLLLPLLVSGANAQAYDAASRSESAFSYVQPLNTTILGAYGHSPPVMPSRKSIPSIKGVYDI
jgi:beta-glucosidase